MKVALFDFCNTLVDFSTGDPFITYILEQFDEAECKVRTRKHLFMRKLHIIQMYDLLVARKILKNKVYLNKRIYLECIKGLSESELNYFGREYYQNRIKSHLVKETVRELERKKAKGYRICVVSGGYDYYLKYFTEEFGINDFHWFDFGSFQC